jgi:serine phosphatase RsbU (regulator of sigma subunit)
MSFDNDSVLFYGNIEINNSSYKLSYDNNSFQIVFSSITSINDFKPQFSFMLEGYDEDWSEYSFDNQVDYKKVPNGTYIFKVKSRDAYGNISDVKSIKIIIASPWYKTVWAYILYVVLLILLIILIVRIYSYRLKKENIKLEKIIEERTQEIRNQKTEIEKHRDVILEQKHEIEDSIHYAKRIQHAVLPDLSVIGSNQLSKSAIHKIDYFILFRPKDIVSGDFYWVTEINNLRIYTVADCTGHGVPGAFMSMLGISFLNEIVRKKEIVQANLILNELRKSIIEALKQTGESGTQKDGMDMSLVIINDKLLIENSNDIPNVVVERSRNASEESLPITTDSSSLRSLGMAGKYQAQWAGANNPLWIIRDNKSEKSSQEPWVLEEIKPDKMPIAIHDHMEDFTLHHFEIKIGDCIYMMSDGYEDQFGGPKGKKFMSKNLKQLLLDNVNLSMTEQNQILEKTLLDWIGNGEQIDDITLMGIRL